MDHAKLARELVRSLRGTRSQHALNRRLGFTSNVAHSWESGARCPKASDFFRLAELAHLDLAPILREFSPHGALELEGNVCSRDNLQRWLASLCHGRSHAALSKALNCNRNTVARWLSGATEPRLAEVLRLVEFATLRLIDFVARFADPATLPSLRRAYRDLSLQRRIAYELPWAQAVLHALELEVYRAQPRHMPGLIASQLGITLAEEEQAFAALAAARQIRRVGAKWASRRVLTVDTRTNPEGNLSLKRHFSLVGVERLARPSLPVGGQFSYNVFAISDDGLERIRAAHLQYFERLRAIVAECQNPTRVVLANVQLIPLDG